MKSKLTMTCPTCKGQGVVAREKGKTVGGLDDEHATAHLWPALCSNCNGSGRVMDPGPQVEP